MKPWLKILFSLALLVLVQLACNVPAGIGTVSTPTPEPFPTPIFATPEVTATNTLPPIVTATSAAQPGEATQTPSGAQPTATGQPSPTPTRGAASGNCTHLATFVSDVTIPDDSVIEAGKSFVKTWRVRNDGTCTWGPNQSLRALAFSSGNKMGSPDQVALTADVAPGKTVDISVTFTAPSNSGTYTSEWVFRLSSGQTVGLGSSRTGALFVRIKVGTGTAANATRVKFAAGATSANLSGDLKAKETRGFVLAAMRNQVIIASLSSGASAATVKITAADGKTLSGNPNPNGSEANAALPSSQDYTVWVTAGDKDTSFKLSITIPSRINFDSGATSDKVSGKTIGRDPTTYVLWAKGGQTLTAKLEGANTALSIYGLKDGKFLVRADSGATSWSGKLPSDQDYILSVVPSADNASFTVNLTIQ